MPRDNFIVLATRSNIAFNCVGVEFAHLFANHFVWPGWLFDAAAVCWTFCFGGAMWFYRLYQKKAYLFDVAAVIHPAGRLAVHSSDSCGVRTHALMEWRLNSLLPPGTRRCI